MKSRMVRLSTRVETLKEVLQKYLDDDADMKDLNLSAKCAEWTNTNTRYPPGSVVEPAGNADAGQLIVHRGRSLLHIVAARESWRRPRF